MKVNIYSFIAINIFVPPFKFSEYVMLMLNKPR